MWTLSWSGGEGVVRLHSVLQSRTPLASAGFLSELPAMLALSAAARTAQATALSVSRSSRSDISSVQLVQSQGLETEASLAFMRVVRGAFPTAAFDAAALAELYNGETRLSREFTEAKWPQKFAAARYAFVSTTLAMPLPTAGSQSRVLWADTHRPGGSVEVEAKYVNPAFDKIEVDCLMKIEVSTDIEWAQDPDVARSSGGLSFVSASADASVPMRQSPPVLPARWCRKSDVSNGSTRTARHYHPLTNYYVIGEVFYPLHQGMKGAGVSHNPAIQKLVQLERSLQFLSHKEGKCVTACVAGALLISPAFNRKARAHIVAELRLFPQRFPCLCELNACQRLLLLQLPHSTAAAAALFRDHEGVLDVLADIAGRLADLERRMGPAAPASMPIRSSDTVVAADPPVSAVPEAFAVAAAVSLPVPVAVTFAPKSAAAPESSAPTAQRQRRKKKKKAMQSQSAPLPLDSTTAAGAVEAASTRTPVRTQQAAEHTAPGEAPTLLESGRAWLLRWLRW